MNNNEATLDRIKNIMVNEYSMEYHQVTANDIYDFLWECKVIYKEDCGSHRWWNDLEKIVEIEEDFLVSYADATTTGDSNAREVGWEFDAHTVLEVYAQEEVVTKITYMIKSINDIPLTK